MSNEDGIWPWGECDHYSIGPFRAWCKCGEHCTDPHAQGSELLNPDDAAWMLCRCCREPLYQLRIAELEAGPAMLRRCEGHKGSSEACFAQDDYSEEE